MNKAGALADPAHAAAEHRNRIVGEALALAADGIPVFPCVPNGKKPMTRNGFRDATTDRRKIRRWWSYSPCANLAVPTGTLSWDVLDVDVRGDGDGLDLLEVLCLDTAVLSGALTKVRTPSANRTLTSPAVSNEEAHPPSARGLPSQGCLRARTAVVRHHARLHGPVPSTSLREHGRPLDWDRAKQLAMPPGSSGPPRSMGQTTGSRHDRMAALVSAVADAREGHRNSMLFWAANRALEMGGDLSRLGAAAQLAGLSSWEIEATLASARRTTGGAG